MAVYPVGGTSSAASPATPERSDAVPRVDGAPEAVDLLDAMNTGHAAVTWLSTVGIGSRRGPLNARNEGLASVVLGAHEPVPV